MSNLRILSIVLASVCVGSATGGCGSDNGKFITATGTIEATETTLSAQVPGIVVQLRVDEGSLVHTGDTLAEIDKEEWRLQVAQSEANLAAAQAQFDLTNRGAREEDILQAEANYKNAAADLTRMQELSRSGTVSPKQLEDAQTRATVTKQTYEKLKRGSREEEIQMARARRDQAAAQLNSLRKKLNDCSITTPVEGTVTKRYVEQGEFVGAGMSIVRIANLQEMDLMIYIPEAELPFVKLGSRTEVQVDAFKDRTFEGKVVFISPIAEFTPKNIQTKDERVKLVFGVKVKVLNPDGSLKAGLPADVAIAK
ncbi:MAG: efflux RND transporter periplasmic adaptor subunit [Ignavibacteriales bacterium]|nr:efflux RND transporter periplasmic adaptor subunit [Ignavibacteriales bacterium]